MITIEKAQLALAAGRPLEAILCARVARQRGDAPGPTECFPRQAHLTIICKGVWMR